MKRIEAIIARSALDDFHRCAKSLGIFGFDLSAPKTRLCDNQRLSIRRELRSVAGSKIKVEFAVLDEQTKPTIHAVLETVHPESIGIFKFDEDASAVVRPRPNPARIKSMP
jgi:nitrogen regulatory protein PII